MRCPNTQLRSFLLSIILPPLSNILPNQEGPTIIPIDANTMAERKDHPQPPQQLAPLLKQKSWSPDSYRDELWLKRKERSGSRRSKSLTDEDFDDLKACFELGFGFDSPDLVSDSRLSDTLPALGFYFAVNKSYNDTVLKSNKSSFSSENDTSTSSPVGSPLTMFSPGDDPKTIKTRLRHWAQVVACSVRRSW